MILPRTSSVPVRGSVRRPPQGCKGGRGFPWTGHLMPCISATSSTGSSKESRAAGLAHTFAAWECGGDLRLSLSSFGFADNDELSINVNGRCHHSPIYTKHIRVILCGYSDPGARPLQRGWSTHSSNPGQRLFVAPSPSPAPFCGKQSSPRKSQRLHKEVHETN